MSSYEVGNRSIAGQALRQGRNDTGLAKPQDRVHRAKVLSVDEGFCQVVTLDENDNELRIYSLVALPAGMTLAPDDLVTIKVHEMDKVPVIMSGAGGGGGCSRFASEWGVLFS